MIECIYALKWLSAHSCSDILHSANSTDITHRQETKFLDFIVPFQKAPFMNKAFSRVPPNRFCWAESHYGPAYFPIETDKWPFDEAALWPFSQSWVNKWETSVWGFEEYGIKNRKRGQIIRIHPAVQWTSFQKRVPLSIQQLHNKETLNHNQMVTMASPPYE